MTKRTRLVYGLLLAAWGLIVVWQVFEHDRVKKSERTALLNRSRDITTTLGLVIRSQRRFGGIVTQERLESALNELVKSGELISVALLNVSGEVVASAGPRPPLEPGGLLQTGEHWDRDRVTLVNLVDLGATVPREGDSERPTIVVPRRDPNDAPPDGEGRPPRPPDGPPPGPPRDRGGGPDGDARRDREERDLDGREGENRDRRRPPFWGWRFPRRDDPEYQTLLQKRGVHGLVLALSTADYRRACARDLWMRWFISGLAGLSALGLGLAWGSFVKSSELQIRLLRASELNTHLKEMNLAAAGLAHETRNPLNIVRGLAQLIARQPEASPDMCAKARAIVDETDRITAQLNEFINYSRPREVRRAPVSLAAVIGEVVRALSYDLEEKQVRLEVTDHQLHIEADEQLLRQALFNLLLNAIQAVPVGGRIQVVASRAAGSEAVLEVRDNGPGVPPEHRTNIFKPYFTTHQKGTGLGLAVVQQIVLAHGWEIACLANEPTGAVFRITHLELTKGSPRSPGATDPSAPPSAEDLGRLQPRGAPATAQSTAAPARAEPDFAAATARLQDR